MRTRMALVLRRSQRPARWPSGRRSRQLRRAAAHRNHGDPPQLRVRAVIPYFEGWIKNPDGTFDMVFGYFNRNFVQEFAIPAGPGQQASSRSARRRPADLLPAATAAIHRSACKRAGRLRQERTGLDDHVQRPDRAGYGNLMPPQEITERVVMTNGNFDPGHDDPNKPPSITVAPPASAAVGTAATLVASVADDGLPKPRVAPAEPRPAQPASPGGFGAQINSSGGGRGARPLSVTWVQYRRAGEGQLGTDGCNRGGERSGDCERDVQCPWQVPSRGDRHRPGPAGDADVRRSHGHRDGPELVRAAIACSVVLAGA